MSDLNDLSKPVTTDTEPNVLDTIRAHIVRAITWTGYSATANKVAGMMSAVTAAVSGGRSLRLYRRNDANTGDEEVVTLPAISVGGNAATASAAQSGSGLETALAAKAPLASPTFSGTPTVPTATAGTNTTQAASTAFVATAVANVVQSAPAALDTLNELAIALGNDPNFATSTATALGNRVVKTSANRPGVSKLYRRDDDSDYNIQVNWTGARWRLKGYSGDTFHAEAEVSYADSAGAVAWGNVSGKPTNFVLNDSGTYSINIGGNAAYATNAGYATSAGSAATAGNGGVTSIDSVQGAITLANLASFDRSIGANGYQKLPGGLIVQWGTLSGTAAHGSNVNINFPIAFSSQCFAITSSMQQGVSTLVTSVYFSVVGLTTTGATLQYGSVNGGTYTYSYRWIAFGI